VRIDNSTFTGNAPAYGYGGAITSHAPLTITNSTITGNTAAAGGGIYNSNTLTVTGCTFSGNIGGGINNYAIVNVTESTFANNSNDYEEENSGGLYNAGTATVTNCTFSGNYGFIVGGIYNSGALTLQNSTFWNNRGFGAKSLFNVTSNNSTTVSNSILDYAYCGAAPGSQISQSSSNNLTDHTTNCGSGLTVSSQIFLGPLGNYGGSTQTMPLLPGSAAIDAGSGCPATDQRGVARPQGSACDIGAFESQGFTLAISGGNNQSATINTAFADPLSVTMSETGGSPLPGAVVTFTGPVSGASRSRGWCCS